MTGVSIVIPCYRPEQSKLQRCISSVLNQTYSDYEVIIVDDGNSQEDLKILQHVADSDKRITIITQNNKGVSSARNCGIMNSHGKYIAFVDADDYILDSFLAEAFSVAEKTNADIVIGGVRKVSEKNTSYQYNTHHQMMKYSGEEILKLKKFMVGKRISFEDEGYINSGPVARLIKTDLARKAMFPEDISIGEDMIWNLMLFDLAASVTIVKSIWYLYYYNENSASHKYNPRIIQILKKQAERLKENLDLSDPENYHAYCINLILSLRLINDCYINHSESALTFAQRKREMKKLYTDPLFQMIASDRFFNKAGASDKLKSKLFKGRCLFYFWNIIDHLERLKGKSGW